MTGTRCTRSCFNAFKPVRMESCSCDCIEGQTSARTHTSVSGGTRRQPTTASHKSLHSTNSGHDDTREVRAHSTATPSGGGVSSPTRPQVSYARSVTKGGTIEQLVTRQAGARAPSANLLSTREDGAVLCGHVHRLHGVDVLPCGHELPARVGAASHSSHITSQILMTQPLEAELRLTLHHAATTAQHHETTHTLIHDRVPPSATQARHGHVLLAVGAEPCQRLATRRC